MSAILNVGENAWWRASIGIFEVVLTCIADELEANDSELAAMLRKPVGAFSYLDLEPLSGPQFLKVIEATMRAYEYQGSEGWQTQTELSPYGPYGMLCFSELKVLLVIDERAGDQFYETLGKILLRDEAVWEAPGWVHDLVLEIIAAEIQEKDASLAAILMRARTTFGDGLCDLRPLDAAKFQLFVEPVDKLNLRYPVSNAPAASTPEFPKIFYPNVTRLYQLFRVDSRANDTDWPFS